LKIAFFEVEEWEKKILQKVFRKHTLFFSKNKISLRSVSKVKDYDILSVFIYSKVDKAVINAMPKLKLITTRSTGFDHIDLKESKSQGIKVCNVPTYGENTVAEHTFALILNISRRMYESFLSSRKGDFRLKGLRGFDLKDKTIGVVGCGNIGKHVARIAKGFEMNVLVYDVHKDLKLAKKLGFKYVSLDRLLKKSDIVSLHCPDNKHTHHMIDSNALKKVKKGAILINTARGGLVDTTALIKALNNKTITYAGLDVLEGECLVKEEKSLLHPEFMKTCDLKNVLQNNILLRRDNVYITPHNAFNSQEALMRILDTTIDNINGFSKKKLANVIRFK